MDEQAIYQAALLKETPALRDAWLQEACGDNPWLLQHLKARIESDLRSGVSAVPVKAPPVPMAELRRLVAAIQEDPNNLELVRNCGFALATHERFGDALKVWQRIEDQDPDSVEASDMVTKFIIEKSRHNDGKRDAKPAAAAEPVATPAPKIGGKPAPVDPSTLLTPIQRLEGLVRDCPADPDIYLQLVPLYLEKGREYDAERLLSKGKEATYNNAAVVQLWEDVRLLRMEKSVALAKKQLQTASTTLATNEAQNAVNEALAKQERLELEIMNARVKRVPNDAKLASQLGQRLARSGKGAEARPHLEAAMKDPEECAVAAIALGEVLQKMQALPEALQAYSAAAEAAQEQHQLPLAEQALFHAGKLAHEMKFDKIAQRYLKELLALDPEHAEAKQLLRRLDSAS